MKVIGLGHYSRTGKDSFANYFLEEITRINDRGGPLGRTVRAKKVPFAWKLKDVAYQLYAWDGLRPAEFYETPEGAPYRDIVLPTIGKTPVQIWIDLGTPAIREQVYDKTWIDYVLRTDHQCDVLLIPDVRFPNEVAAIKELGGTLIKVVRPGYGPRKSKADRALLGFTGWDYVIGSSGEMSELRDWAMDFAAWRTGRAPQPWQEDDEKKAALAVEKIEPWAAEKIESSESSFTLTVNRALAEQLMLNEQACYSESLGGDTKVVLRQVAETFPDLAEQYSYLYPVSP